MASEKKKEKRRARARLKAKRQRKQQPQTQDLSWSSEPLSSDDVSWYTVVNNFQRRRIVD